MSKLTKYESIEALKATAKPMDKRSSISQQRHDRFKDFINLLKGDSTKDASASLDNTSAN